MKSNWPLKCFFCISLVFFLTLSSGFASDHPKKIVSLSPSTTEWLFAFGLEDQVVGVTEQCDFPSDAMKKSKVGSFMQTSAERILALRPTDVVTVEGLPEALKRKLQSSGIQVHIFSPQRLGHFPGQIIDLGRRLGVRSRAQALANSFQTAINNAIKKSEQSKKSKQSFLIFIATDPIYLVRKNTWMSDLFEVLGYVNALQQAQSEEPFPRVSFESLFKLKAHFWIGFADKQDSRLLAQERLKTLFERTGSQTAAQILILPSDMIQRPGPRLVDVLRNGKEIGL